MPDLVLEIIGFLVIVSLLAMFAPPLVAGVVTGLAAIFGYGQDEKPRDQHEDWS